MYKQWGIADADELSVADLLAKPLLIPKSFMVHGVADLALLYDQELGQNTFFGGDHQPQPYETFAEHCMVRDQQYADITENVLRDLLKAIPLFTKDFEANQLMQDLVEKYAGLRATKDTSIDARNFGAVAAASISQARVEYSQGNIEAYAVHAALALAQAVTSACGISSSAKSGNDPLSSLRSVFGGSDEMIDDPEDQSKWAWKRGRCRIESCSWSKMETWIGPCDVCEHCQKQYNQGGDPAAKAA
jgi:hypothetical protein